MSRPEEPAEMETEDFAPRYRLRGKNHAVGGAAGSKRARTTRVAKGASSDNEEMEEEVRTAWLADLEKRSPADLRNAFTVKPCSAKELRQLGDEAFLGGKRRPGALPIYDLEGKVSLQFLLATYKASEKSRERRGEDSEVDLHRPFLRWLIRKARELRLLNSREVRRGTLAAGRVDVASKSGQWLLSLEQNQAEASDEEGPRKKAMERAQVIAAASLKLDVQFPSRAAPKAGSPEGGNGTALLKERLRNQLQAKKEKIDAQSSDGLDLQKMCDRLMAPSLSFDWDEPESDEEDSSKGILQVELPASASDSEGRRALLREQIQRSVSFKQAKELSKVKSLPSSSSLQKEDVRNAATPTKSKKRKTQLSNEPSVSMEESKTQELPDAKEVQEPPAGAASDAVSASGPASTEVSKDLAETEASPVPVEPSKDQAETTASGGDAQEISAVSAALRPDEGLPAPDIEISPTLRFEPEEPQGALGGLDISPTLPFDIDASALQEACRVEEACEAEAANAAEVAAVEKAVEEWPEIPEEPEVEEAMSSEDEELKGDARALRERAWLRHKRNMQAAQLSQEDDGEAFAPVGRAPKRRVKGSILMKT